MGHVRRHLAFVMLACSSLGFAAGPAYGADTRQKFIWGDSTHTSSRNWCYHLNADGTVGDSTDDKECLQALGPNSRPKHVVDLRFRNTIPRAVLVKTAAESAEDMKAAAEGKAPPQRACQVSSTGGTSEPGADANFVAMIAPVTVTLVDGNLKPYQFEPMLSYDSADLISSLNIGCSREDKKRFCDRLMNESNTMIEPRKLPCWGDVSQGQNGKFAVYFADQVKPGEKPDFRLIANGLGKDEAQLRATALTYACENSVENRKKLCGDRWAQVLAKSPHGYWEPSLTEGPDAAY